MDAKQGSAVLALMLLTSMPAYAQTHTVGDLADIQAKTLILKAQLAQQEAEKKLREAGGDASAAAVKSEDEVDLPVVRDIAGSGDVPLQAWFLYSDGRAISAGKGEAIPGGFTVHSMSANRVEISKGKRVYALGFSPTKPIVQPRANTVSSVPGYPMPPALAPNVSMPPAGG